MKRHSSLHLGYKLFQCTFDSCNRGFARKDAYVIHVKNKHPHEVLDRKPTKAAKLASEAAEMAHSKARGHLRTRSTPNLRHDSPYGSSTAAPLPPPPNQRGSITAFPTYSLNTSYESEIAYHSHPPSAGEYYYPSPTMTSAAQQSLLFSGLAAPVQPQYQEAWNQHYAPHSPMMHTIPLVPGHYAQPRPQSQVFLDERDMRYDHVTGDVYQRIQSHRSMMEVSQF